jgi:hypothetical protein
MEKLGFLEKVADVLESEEFRETCERVADDLWGEKAKGEK